MTWWDDGMRARPSLVGQGRDAGFSLLEMLVVLAIMALVLSGAPPLFESLQAFRLKSAAAALVDNLREWHELAVRQGTTVEVVFDLPARAYAGPGSVKHLLPPVVDALGFQGRAIVGQALAPSIARLRFFPDGSSSGGALSLRHSHYAQRIVVEWLTGRVLRDE